MADFYLKEFFTVWGEVLCCFLVEPDGRTDSSLTSVH